MAKRLEFDIVTDASKGISGLKQFAGAAKKAMGEVNDSLDDTTTSAQKVAKALSGLADELEGEMKGAAKAAGALSDALGPELAGRANVDSVVQDLHKMGLTFDEITADADALAGSLKKLDGVQMSGVETSAQRTSDSMGKIVDGADKASNATANLVGNAGQDLGELVGVTGSAGVALGQLAEGFADSAFAAKEAGQGYGAIAGSMLKALGPIAAISAGVAIVGAAMQAFQKPAADAARITGEMGDAMANTADDALAFAQVLRDNAKDLTDFIAAANDPLGGFGVAVDEAASHVPLIGKYFKEAGVDVFDASKRAGFSVYDLGKQIQGAGLTTKDFNARLQTAVDAGKITKTEMNAVAEALKNYGDSAAQAAKDQGLFNVGQKEANALLQELLDQKDPLRRLTDQWETLMSDLADGQINTAQAATAVNDLATALGIDPNEVISIALEQVNKKAEEFQQGFDDAASALDDFQANMDDFAVSALDAAQAVDDMLNPFEILGRKSDVLQTIFDLKNAPRKTASAVRDVKQEIDDLSEAMKGIHVGDVLAGGIKADKFLDAIDKLGPDIQARIDEKFGTDGAPAAKKLANSYITQVTKELGGKFTRAQVATMLGLDNIQATIDIAIDQASLTEATGLLEVLTGIHGNDPWTAQVKLDMAAGNITPDTAKVLIAERLGDFGIDVPTALLPPDGASMDAARESANMYNALHKAQMPTEATAPENLDFMLQDAQGQINNKPALTVPVKAKFDSKAFDFLFNDAGGTVGPEGGIAGERRPEIVDGRYLVVGPTYVPPGSRVTSGARTAHILRHGHGRGLRRYDAGGVVPANVTTNVNLHLPAGSNGADVVRQVKRWQRRNGRAV